MRGNGAVVEAALDDEKRPSESGMATVWAVNVIAVLLVISLGLVWFGVAVIARHKAAAAADLAALAAASRATWGEQMACERARWVSRQMSVELMSCRLSRQDALVEVSSRALGIFSTTNVVVARARAGPMDASQSEFRS